MNINATYREFDAYDNKHTDNLEISNGWELDRDNHNNVFLKGSLQQFTTPYANCQGVQNNWPLGGDGAVQDLLICRAVRKFSTAAESDDGANDYTFIGHKNELFAVYQVTNGLPCFYRLKPVPK